VATGCYDFIIRIWNVAGEEADKRNLDEVFSPRSESSPVLLVIIIIRA
jgi:hypothetical protein